ncbi:MAG: hypothetical protein C4567_17010 [Deltaproteobacteria bacterium]|nr:MAG: hypothetical protein C4567_17010 [Deltaproteobacteria bacterium]
MQDNPQYQGVKRVVVFLQRWPGYLQLSNQSNLSEGFIKKGTHFLGPWEKAAVMAPRALDIRDIDDTLIGEVLLEALTSKGYQPFLAEALPGPAAAPLSVAAIMDQYQVMDSGTDAFLFCFYAPTLYLSHPPVGQATPGNRSYSLLEAINLVDAGSQGVTWAGPRAALAPKNSISHGFIYISMTVFKAPDQNMLWEVAGSQTGGRTRPWIPQCPPGPTDQNYWADVGIIQTLMVNNLKCRLRHLIPNAF